MKEDKALSEVLSRREKQKLKLKKNISRKPSTPNITPKKTRTPRKSTKKIPPSPENPFVAGQSQEVG